MSLTRANSVGVKSGKSRPLGCDRAAAVVRMASKFLPTRGGPPCGQRGVGSLGTVVQFTFDCVSETVKLEYDSKIGHKLRYHRWLGGNRYIAVADSDSTIAGGSSPCAAFGADFGTGIRHGLAT